MKRTHGLRNLSRAAALVAIAVLAACGAGAPDDAASDSTFTKPIAFSVLEDYDEGEDLERIARDFRRMRELGVDTWRGSFGWDDYEPAPGEYDFEWLHAFADLADRHGIELRPYLAYTAPWAAAGGGDDQYWNDPPADPDAWYDFVHRLVSEMERHPNIASYEIYNEQNVKLWWDGTVAEYNEVLARGAAAVRAADPDAEVILGGLVHPDAEWLERTCTGHGNADRFDVVAFHAYPETWTGDTMRVETFLGERYRDRFLPVAEEACGDPPVWINEMGYATTAGRTERQQANWWARAVATFVAAPAVEHIGIYEIRDLRSDSPVIGDGANYHLGLIRRDGRPKLAFHTVDLLTDLLDTGTITVADGAVDAAVAEGRAGRLHHHLFRRPDGRRVLFVWDETGAPTLDLRLARDGTDVVEYALDGTATPYASFDGTTLTDVRLQPGQVRIFEIRP